MYLEHGTFSEELMNRGKMIRIEICSTEFGVHNGSLMYKDGKCGHIQFNFADKPKRVGNLVKALRKAGIEVKYPSHWKESDE